MSHVAGQLSCCMHLMDHHLFCGRSRETLVWGASYLQKQESANGDTVLVV